MQNVKTHYISQTKFKYPSWRRIEDRKIVYSMSGVPLMEASRYTVELTKWPSTYNDKVKAIQELILATVEYGQVAPEPCTERWIETEEEDLVDLQNLRVFLYNFYEEHNLLSPHEEEERNVVYNYLLDKYDSNTLDIIDAIDDLMSTYKYGMFSDKYKWRKGGYTQVSRKKRRKLAAKSKNVG